MIELVPPKETPYGRTNNDVDVLIIGAGISGMCTAIEMIRAGTGRNFIIVEKSSQVGGTWNDNAYPGCCCDGMHSPTLRMQTHAARDTKFLLSKVWSHLYSFSFEPNPNWTRQYPGQQEIQEYLIQVALKYQLYKHIRFTTAVDEARWDESTNKWRTTITRLGGKEAEIGSSYTITSDFLVSAVGQLNVPKYPDLKGLRDFKGKTMHTARWDWDYDVRGKRIGIIGTGATAAQVIPEIASVCKSLVIFQRTPAWVIPRHDAPITLTMQTVYKYVPFIRQRYRASLMDLRESNYEASVDPDSESHSHITKIARQHRFKQIPGKENNALRENLTPNYPFSCKRIIVSDDYYPSLLRENVSFETTPITEMTTTGCNVQSGAHHEMDLLITATGFRTTQFLYPIRIIGISGHSLEDAWSDYATAYLGISVQKMPNFGMLYGPNTNLAYSSLILQIEAQSKYIHTMISAVLNAKRKGKTLSLIPKDNVVMEYNQDIQDRLAHSTFSDPSCTSWFKNEAGLITHNWFASAVAYQKRTSFLDWTEYEICGTAAAAYTRKGVTRWKRVVEETQVSNLMAGLATIVVSGAMVAGYTLFGKTLIHATWMLNW
ncbi:MAG: hypothetical protein M1827_003527 [Pycnora praestabilis]|nr:MAG: hypothetical protein M1827_003527 [Pycnora praestabilis]